MTADRWIVRWAAASVPRLRLFCLPYAGGGAQIYRTWPQALPDGIEVCAVQLPGRERRYAEAPIRSAAEAVAILAEALRPLLDRPFALFGHSMGAVLAYELARRLAAEAGRMPEHLFVSGQKAPHLPSRRRPLHRLPDAAFLDGVRALDGTPAEVFRHPELVELLMPMLRADFELVETYAELPGPRLSCPITALGGSDDPDVPLGDVEAWRGATGGPFRSEVVEGDHFFVNSARARVVEAVRRALEG